MHIRPSAVPPLRPRCHPASSNSGRVRRVLLLAIPCGLRNWLLLDRPQCLRRGSRECLHGQHFPRLQTFLLSLVADLHEHCSYVVRETFDFECQAVTGQLSPRRSPTRAVQRSSSVPKHPETTRNAVPMLGRTALPEPGPVVLEVCQSFLGLSSACSPFGRFLACHGGPWLRRGPLFRAPVPNAIFLPH